MTFWITEFLDTCAESDLTEPGIVVVDVRDLADGKNGAGIILNRLTLIHFLLIDGWKVIVRCGAGVSRSNAIAAGALAIQNNIDYEDALNLVKSKVPRALPNMDIIDSVKEAVKKYREGLSS